MPTMVSDFDGDGDASGEAMQLEALQETLQAEEEWLQVSNCQFMLSTCPAYLCHCRLCIAYMYPAGMRRARLTAPLLDIDKWLVQSILNTGFNFAGP